MLTYMFDSVSKSVNTSIGRIQRRVVAAVLFLIGLGFFVAAAFIYVSRFYDAITTTVVFGAAFVVLALLLAAINAIASRPPRRAAPSNLTAAALANPVETASLVNMLSRSRSLSLLPLLAAVALGIAITGKSGARPRE